MSEETFSSLTLRLLTKLLMFTSGPINCELFCGDWGRIFLESRWNLQKQRNSVLTWTAWGVYGFMGLCEFVSLSALLRACCPFIQITNEDIKQGWSLYWSLAYTTGYWLLTSTALWVWPFKSFQSTSPVIQPPCGFVSLPMRMLWKTVLKAFLKEK